MTKLLHGIVCAMITPMDNRGKLDEESIASLTCHLRDAGIDGLYPNGTNGESLSLTEEERKTVSEIVLSEAKAIPAVYIQCGSTNIDQTIRLAQHAEKIGADGAGIMTPSFFKCDEMALTQYYEQIFAQIKDFPIYVYNIPSCTGNDLSPTVLSKLLSEEPNLQGIKFSAPDMMRIREYLLLTKNVLIGCDSMILDCLIAGGAGTVSGPCAIFSERFVRLYKEYQAGDFISAIETQKKIYKTAQLMSEIPEIPAIKLILKWRGIIKTETCRAPFRKLTLEEQRRLEKIYDDYAIQK